MGRHWARQMRAWTQWLPTRIAHAKASLHTKLLAAFLLLAGLLLVAGIVGLDALMAFHHRSEQTAQMQRKIAAYRQLNHQITSQLYGVASALIEPNEHTLEAVLRQLNQFGYDLDRLQFISQDEVKLHARIRADFEEFIGVVTQMLGFIRQGMIAQGRALQVTRANPLAARLERTMNELVNKAEEALVESAQENQHAYARSRVLVVSIIAASILLALVLGFGISRSLIAPVHAMERRMREIAAGDFSSQVLVANRDELGVLAADLNRMSQQLAGLYGALESASRHKSEFLAHMSHELRTPLNAIIGCTEVLRSRISGELNSRQMDYLRDILMSSRHLLSMINDVLDLAKIEAGKTELELTRFDLAGTIEHVLALVRTQAGTPAHTMAFDIAPELASFVADERKIRQVLINLVSNAVKFTPAGGRIEVRASVSQDAAHFQVMDTGIGIAPEDHDTIFEQFRQAGADPLRKRAGTGLGLAIARKFIELHGGRIWVESALGQGARFTFTLPMRSAA